MSATRDESRLRRACLSDLDAIVAIDRQRMAPGWPRDEMATALKSERWRVTVAEDAEAGIVGFCLSRRIVDEIELLKIAVSEDLGGLGLGKKLLDELITSAHEIVSINLEVRRGNGPALRLYRARGFEVVGERPRYYPDGEDALLMTLTL